MNTKCYPLGIVLLILSFWPVGVSAQPFQGKFSYFYSPDGERLVAVRRGEVEQSPHLRSSRQVTDPILEADAYLDAILDANRSQLGDGLSSNDFIPTLVQQLASGKTKVWYQQTFQSVPVYSGTVSITLDSEFDFVSAYTNVLDRVSVSVKPEVNKLRAIKKSRKAIYRSHVWRNARVLLRRQSKRKCRTKSGSKKVELSRCVRKRMRRTLKDYRPRLYSSPELIVYRPSALQGVQKGTDLLAWKFQMQVFEERLTKSFYVDAHTGEILQSNDSSTYQQPVRKIYDCSWDEIDSCLIDHHFDGYYYGRSEGEPERGINPDNGSLDVDLAYDLSLDAHNVYQNFLGRDGANDRGGMGDPHVGIPFEFMRVFTHLNNFAPLSHICNGVETNGTSSATTVAFCTGSVLPEIFGHEYAHVLTYYLRYDSQTKPQALLPDINHYGETQAITEGIADFLGEYFHYKLDGTLDWVVGTGTSTVTRDFAHPASALNVATDYDTFPETYTDPNFYCGANASTYAHTNQSVVNKANYLLSVGGSFNGCEIDGIGIDKVARIWMSAIEDYFLPDNGQKLYDLYLHLGFACLDLASDITTGVTSSDCEQVTAALQSVHLDKLGGCVCAEFDGQECVLWEHHQNVGTTEPASCVEEDLEVPGDFNGDSIVDKSDWSIWFTSKGDEGEGLPADADLSGRVGVEDCEIWKGNFGAGTCLEDDSEGCVEPEYFRGDYDLDGDNDVDDYQVWRSSFGVTDANHPADGNKDGSVDLADYTVWRDSLGAGSCAE